MDLLRCRYTLNPFSMTLHCNNCKARLTEPMWRDQGEYFISCFGCGVRNIVLPMLQIVGYREEVPLFPKPSRSSPARATLSVAAQGAPETRQSRVIAGSGLD